MNGELPQQIIHRRREMVRHLHYTGLSVPLILERLEKHDFLFPLVADYDEKYSMVATDIAAIKKAAMEAIAIDEFDIKQQHALYIDRANFLYYQALQDGNLSLAGNFSKDIARAYGVQTDEPIIVQGDMLNLLKGAQVQAQKRLQERKAIDVTPEKLPDVVRPQSEVILNKR